MRALLARKIAAAKKRGRGGNSFPPNPLSFPPRPSGLVSAAPQARHHSGFRSKKVRAAFSNCDNKNMLKEEIINPNTNTETKHDHLKDLFEEIGLDVEKINPNIMRKLRLLNEKTETFKDEERSLQVARSLFEYYKNRLADIRFTDQEQRVILIGTMFADIGKTGPKDATPEQEEIILDIYNVENINVKGINDPAKITL